jgi:hypothetical protein
MSSPAPTRPRFGLFALLAFITGCCAVFGVLAALRVSPWGVLVGFIAVPVFCAALIGIIELFATLTGQRPR